LIECEVWSLKPWEEETEQHESENNVMKTSGPKKAYTTRQFRTVQKEFLNVQSSKNKVKVTRVVRACRQDGQTCFQILVKKQFEKPSFGRPRQRWGDNIKRDLNGKVYRTKSGLSPMIAISITKLHGCSTSSWYYWKDLKLTGHYIVHEIMKYLLQSAK